MDNSLGVARREIPMTAGPVALLLFTRQSSDELAPGQRFRGRPGGRFIETAEVLELAVDRSGISHVRYRLRLGPPSAPASIGADRTLAVDQFRARYPVPA